MLTLQYLPFRQISSLNTTERVQLILSILKTGKIVLIDGRLESRDEAMLIRETMSNIDDNFNGVEMGVMYDHQEKNFIAKIKYSLARTLIGDRDGITFIGPAKIISELRQHPETVELCFQKDYLLKQSRSNSDKERDTYKKKIKTKIETKTQNTNIKNKNKKVNHGE